MVSIGHYQHEHREATPPPENQIFLFKKTENSTCVVHELPEFSRVSVNRHSKGCLSSIKGTETVRFQ